MVANSGFAYRNLEFRKSILLISDRPLTITEKEINKKIEEQENDGYIASILTTVESLVEGIKYLFSSHNEGQSGTKVLFNHIIVNYQYIYLP